MSLKIAVVGAGSYVFGPSVLSQALLEHGMNGIELALMDVDGTLVERVAGVGNRMARERGLTDTRVTAHTSRESALDGAAFVICCASPQMQRRYRMDLEIIARYAPGHQPSEFGGIAGISYSLRNIAFITSLAADMRRWCPSAWLLCVSNPLPRVMQAAHRGGVRGIGFCSVASVAYGMVAELLDGAADAYPFSQTQERYSLTSAGLNHHAFVTQLTDRATGEDALPRLREAVAGGRTCGNPRAERLLRQSGYLLTPTDEHTRDFFTPEPDDIPPAHETTWHGTEIQRTERLALLDAIARGETGWDAILTKLAWERPLDVIAAMTVGTPTEFDALNLINEGQIPNLMSGVFVETPTIVDADGPHPIRTELPEAVAPYCQRTALVSETLVNAVLSRKKALLMAAVELDPTITGKPEGREAVKACLTAHAELIPTFE